MVNQAHEQTQFWVIRLPKTQRFACSKRDIKSVFSGHELDWVSIGAFAKAFSIQTRYVPRPYFSGPVVATISTGGGAGPYLSLYPVRLDQYPQSAADEFKSPDPAATASVA
jgi:hypothetical protein